MPEYQRKPERVSAVQFVAGGKLPPGVEAVPGGGFATADGTRIAFGDYVLEDGTSYEGPMFEAIFEPVPEPAKVAPPPPAVFIPDPEVEIGMSTKRARK